MSVTDAKPFQNAAFLQWLTASKWAYLDGGIRAPMTHEQFTRAWVEAMADYIDYRLDEVWQDEMPAQRAARNA